MSGVSRWGFRIGSALVLAILLASLVINCLGLEELAEGGAREGKGRDRDARIEVERTLSLLKDAETGQRGYLLTGKESYLAPYREAIPQISRSLDLLAKLTADDPAQRARVDELRRAANAKLQELELTIDLRKERGRESAMREVMTDRGKKAMEAARRLTDAIEAREVAREKELTSLRYSFNIVCTSILFLTILIMWARAYLLESQDNPTAAC